MKRNCGAIALALAVVLGGAPLSLAAQAGPAPRGQGGPNLGRSIELALENRQDLGLSADQVRQLEGMKATIDKDVAPLAEEMTALRERIRAGEVERAEGMRQMQALRGKLVTASAPLQGRAQEIFTVEQHRKLQALVRQGRPGAGGPGVGMGQGGPGMGRGGMGMARGGVGMGRGGMGMGRGGGAGMGRAPGMGRMQGRIGGGRGGFGLRPGLDGQGRAPAFGFRQSPLRPPLAAPGRMGPAGGSVRQPGPLALQGGGPLT